MRTGVRVERRPQGLANQQFKTYLELNSEFFISLLDGPAEGWTGNEARPALARARNQRRLNLRQGDQSVRAIPFTDLNNLAEVVAQTPEYEECQVQQLWRQIIGVDVVLSPARQLEILAEARRVNWRFQDLVRIFVLAPEFTQPPAVDPQQELRAAAHAILAECQQCHNQARNSYEIPDLTAFSQGRMSREQALRTARLIVDELDLTRNGHSPQMPPLNRGGQLLDRREIETLAKWLHRGAAGAEGRRQYAAEELGRIMDRRLLRDSEEGVGFEARSLRMMSSLELSRSRRHLGLGDSV